MLIPGSQIRFLWSGWLKYNSITKKREIKFGNFIIKHLPIPDDELPLGKRCEMECLLEYEGEPIIDKNNKRVKLDSNEILSILSFLTHRHTKFIAWTHPSALTMPIRYKNDLGLYGEVKLDDDISSVFEKILRLPEEIRTILIRALTVYSQAINFYTIDITLGILFLCITIEVLASYIYPGKNNKQKKFIKFITENIPNDYEKNLYKEYKVSNNEFKKYIETIYGKYRSGFVHSGREITSSDHILVELQELKNEKTLFAQKEYKDDDGNTFILKSINMRLFENIVWNTIKNYIKSLM